MNQMRVSVVIPAFNEQGRIAEVIKEAKALVDEVVVVDDASTDATAEVAKVAGATVIRNPENLGYIGSIKKGFAHVSGEIVVTLDADGEFAAADIPRVVAPLAAGEAEMVQGARDVVPRPSERFLTWMAGLRGEVGDSGTGLRAIRSDIAKGLRIEGACICGVVALEVLAQGGRVVDVPIKLAPTDKPRKIAWFHLRQFFHVLRELIAGRPPLHPE